MTSQMTAKNNVLNRVRTALGKPDVRDAAGHAEAERYITARAQGPRPAVDGDLSIRFMHRAEAMASSIEKVASLEQIPAAIAGYLDRLNLLKQGVCWPEFGALDWRAQGLNITARAANGDDAIGITGAFCGIAETGTLMFLSGVQTPAATSLLPETHIAILPLSHIVAGMEDGWNLMREEHGATPRAVNFVSGPSRTGDIEQTIVLGAHGPYRVHIILID